MKRATIHSVSIIFLLTGVLVTNACKVQTTFSARDNSDCPGTGNKFCHDTIIRKSAWKGKTENFIRVDCPHANISRVRVITKSGDALLAVITFGFVVKQRVEWDCAQPIGGGDGGGI